MRDPAMKHRSITRITGTLLLTVLVASTLTGVAEASPVPARAAVTAAARLPGGAATAARLPPTLTTTAPLHLRAGSGTSFRALLTIPKGKAVRVRAKAANGWYKVTYAGKTGWASGKYLSTRKPGGPDTPHIPLAHQNSGPNKSRRVVLTFDDCPRTLTSFTAAINYSSSRNIALVLAPTGDCLTSFRHRYGVDLAVLARAKGQWVINHSVSHPDLRTLTCTAAAAQLRGTGVRTNYGRPPYGAIDAGVRCAYAKVGMKIWTWTRDTLDWSTKSKSTTIARASAAKPGDTVLMHMAWQGFAPDSIRRIKSGLDRRGVKLCRAYHGVNGIGPIERTPRPLPSSLPC